MINFQNEEFTPTFEISLVVKDSLGIPTGKRRSLKASDGDAIWEFWSRYQGKPKRHKKTSKVRKN